MFTKYKLPALGLLALAFLSCTKYIDVVGEGDFSFTSPQKDWVYYQDEEIMLSINYKTEDVMWESSKDGDLGKGNHILVYLGQGKHTITASVEGRKKSTDIEVKYRYAGLGSEIKRLITTTPFQFNIARSARYYPYMETMEGSITNFSLAAQEISPVLLYARTEHEPARDVRIEFNRDKERPLPLQNRAGFMPLSTHAVGDEKPFFVESTMQGNNAPYMITCRLYYQSETLSVWTDKMAILNNAAVDTCITSFENTILPRIRTLWGTQADIDHDGKLAVLITDIINHEGNALGFFNPYDFYPLEADFNAENYNPYSNEMDIIYLAAPEANPGDNYYHTKIMATFAHELTHAVAFTAKTWTVAEAGNLSEKRELLSIDEGLAHLSENLCGYSISGGNIDFIIRYLKDTGFYSLTTKNMNGLYDSAGMRGGMTMFLSWLFWRKGGMRWNVYNPVDIIDNGGVTFLQNLINSRETGFANIGKTYGVPVETLFQQMISEINGQRITDFKYQSPIDPLTGEPAALFTNMDYESEGVQKHIGLPIPYDGTVNTNNSLVPWSFVFFEPITISNTEKYILDAKSYTGNILLGLGIQ
jgi:hypothetical protein